MAAERSPLRVEQRSEAIAITGEIDTYTADTLRDALIPTLDSSELRVDVSGVTFIDSSGLRVVLEIHQALDLEGRRLILMNPSGPVARLIEVAGLVPHLHVDPPLEPIDSVHRVVSDR